MMKKVSQISFYTGSREELLPGFTSKFPYISSCSDITKHPGHFCPWHWHPAMELFYLKQGSLEYNTPGSRILLAEGCGGLINSNVPHMTRPGPDFASSTQLLHLFDPSFISGVHGSLIDEKYVTPLTTASQIEIIPLYPDHPEHKQVLSAIRDSFLISENTPGYELKLRSALSDIWFQIFELALPLMQTKDRFDKRNKRLRLMMVYIHEHYAEKISVKDIAGTAFASERECFRLFHDCLHMSPAEYIKNYRLQAACDMLANTREHITFISQSCGFGSSSYMGKIFRESMGCTPNEYRTKLRGRYKMIVRRIFAIRFAIWLKCCISCIIGSISSIPHIRLAVFCYKKAEIRYFFAFLCTIIIIEMNHIPQNPGRTHDCLPLCRSGGLLRLNDSLQLEMPTYIYLAVFISSHYFRIRA